MNPLIVTTRWDKGLPHRIEAALKCHHDAELGDDVSSIPRRGREPAELHGRKGRQGPRRYANLMSEHVGVTRNKVLGGSDSTSKGEGACSRSNPSERRSRSCIMSATAGCVPPSTLPSFGTLDSVSFHDRSPSVFSPDHLVPWSRESRSDEC